MSIVLFPNAKINLGLKVLEKREDGFHNLETLFLPVESCDVLEISKSDISGCTMHQSGITYPGNPNENLCVLAYNALNERYKLSGVKIHLHKQIPVGAGLGGGSSDASFTLKGLNELFSLGISDEQLAKIAAGLGSDCPFFIYNRAMLGKGRGELLYPLNYSLDDDYFIKLVYPPFFVSTAQAYRGIVPRNLRAKSEIFADERPLEELILLPIEQWKDVIVNDFERSVFAQFPQLEQYKKDLYDMGAVYASMSGSGSAMFGIFKKPAKL